MGRYFRSPRRRNVRVWEQLQLLAEHGIRFSSDDDVFSWGHFFDDHGGARWAKAAIAACPCHSRLAGQRLLKTIAQNKTRQRV